MTTPPRWPSKILGWLCDPRLLDEIVGDLEEMYFKWEEMYGTRTARRLYLIHTIKFLRPFIFKRKKRQGMTLNYFKIAWRNITHAKAFSAINVVGLSLGLTCAIVIYSLVSYHSSFDNFHEDTDRTYRIVSEFHGEQVEHWYVVPQPLGKAFANDFSYADKVARTRGYRTVIVSLPEETEPRKFQEEGVLSFAEPAFFEMFNLPTVAGNAAAIKDPNTCLVSQSIAKKYFDTEDVLNKVIRVNSYGTFVDFRIVGVLKDFPNNTHFSRQIYVSYENLKDYNAYFASDKSWGSFNSFMECFVRLKPGVTKEQVEASMPTLIHKYYDDIDEKLYKFNLQPLSEMHSDINYGGSFSTSQAWTLSIVGLLMIAIACINFVNLASAQVLNRSKEVGVRKILGSMRSYIFIQFMVETGLIALIAVVFACVMAQISLPFVNELLKTQLSIQFLSQWQLPVFLFAILIFVVLASGIYPAVLMTRFQPASVLRARFSGGGGFSLRRVLIVAQFVVSQMLIVGMIVIYNQVEYSMNTDLGFSKDSIIMLPIPVEDKMKMQTLDARIASMPGVLDVSLCFEAPGSSINTSTGMRFEGRPQDEVWEINLKEGDDKYLQTFDLKLVAGRNLLPADSVREFIVNETCVQKLGFATANEAIGKRIAVNGGTVKGTIEGVVKDFYNYSFHEAIDPICISINYERFRNCAVKVDMAQAQPLIHEFEKLWSETYPDNIFTYQFVDDRIEEFYESDRAMLRLVESAAIIAILISCLGLYGMMAFLAVKKTKEIGVRKVLGAGVPSILWLFAKEFAVLIAIAFVMATPLAWTAMNQWLQSFVYRVDVSPWTFVLAILCTLVIAAITVSYHSLRSALANPAKALRTE
jgi:ABC-type antimicrobial peptide transport system permease subunit